MPTNTTEPAGRTQSAGSAETSDGGRIMCVIRCAARKSVSAGSAIRSSSGTTTSVAPVHSAIASSNTATSNPGDANCSTRLDASTPIRSCAVATRLAIPSCETTTPFGRPVEPEV